MLSLENRKTLACGPSGAGHRTISRLSAVYSGEEDIDFPANVPLDLSCHLGDLPSYQQRTWKKLFSVLKPLIRSTFLKAGPLSPLALSGLRPSGLYIMSEGAIGWGTHQLQAVRVGGGRSSPQSPWWDPLISEQPGRPGGGHSSPGQSPLTRNSLAGLLNPFQVVLVC